MPAEQFANNVTGILFQDVNAQTTSIPLYTVQGFPTSGNFRILIDDELMLVTAISGNGFTVTRGIESTTPAYHAAGARVTLPLTAGAISQAITERTTIVDVLANLPSPGIAGRQFHATDSPLMAIDTGTSWQYKCGAFCVTPPVDSGWSWVNQGVGASYTSAYGGLYLKSLTTNGSGFNIRGLFKTLPSAPYSIVFGVYLFFGSYAQFALPGVAFRESSSGKIIQLRLDNSSSHFNFVVERYTSPTSQSSAGAVSTANHLNSTPLFIRLKDDGVNRYFSVGPSPTLFDYDQYSESRTTFITPDQYGIVVDAYSQHCAVHCFHLAIS